MSRIFLLPVLFLTCQLAHIVAFVWMIGPALVGSGRAWKIILGYDHLGNSVTGGKRGEAISARAEPKARQVMNLKKIGPRRARCHGQAADQRAATGVPGSVQPPPSTLYSVTWFCRRCRLACTAACWAWNSARWASSSSR